MSGAPVVETAAASGFWNVWTASKGIRLAGSSNVSFTARDPAIAKAATAVVNNENLIFFVIIILANRQKPF